MIINDLTRFTCSYKKSLYLQKLSLLNKKIRLYLSIMGYKLPKNPLEPPNIPIEPLNWYQGHPKSPQTTPRTRTPRTIFYTIPV